MQTLKTDKQEVQKITKNDKLDGLEPESMGVVISYDKVTHFRLIVISWTAEVLIAWVQLFGTGPEGEGREANQRVYWRYHVITYKL